MLDALDVVDLRWAVLRRAGQFWTRWTRWTCSTLWTCWTFWTRWVGPRIRIGSRRRDDIDQWS